MTTQTNRLNGHAPPHSHDEGPSLLTDFNAERAALGCMQFDADSELLSEDLFELPEHRLIFRALVDLRAESGVVDAVTLGHELARRGELERIGGPAKLVELMEAVPHAAHLDHYARALRNLQVRRQAAEIHDGRRHAALYGDIEDAVQGTDLQHELQNRFAPVPISELIGQHRELRPPIVTGVLRQGETLNIIAPPKVGKSWLAYSLALSVVTGRKWLDSLWCNKGNVLLIDNELHPATLAHRIPSVADALGIRRDEYADRFHVIPLRGHVRPISEMQAIFDRTKPGQFALIILDSWYRFLPTGTSENDNASMRDAYNLIDRFADRLRCGFVLIHHSSKGNQAEKAVTDVGAGAGAQSRAADAHMVLRPHKEDGRFVLDAVVRSFAPIEPIVLAWQFPIWRPDSDADPRDLERPKARGDATQDSRDREGRESILNALSEPATRKQLRKVTGMGYDRANRLIRQLADDGSIIIETDPETDVELITKGGRSTVDRPADRPADRADGGGLYGPPKGWTDRPASPTAINSDRGEGPQTGRPASDGIEGEENDSHASSRPPRCRARQPKPAPDDGASVI